MKISAKPIGTATKWAALLVLLASCAPQHSVEGPHIAPSEAACLKAVAGTTNNPNVSLLPGRRHSTSSEVFVSVSGIGEPWACEFGWDGVTVIGVRYTGAVASG
ncbi:MAG: hypothetical protein AAGG56_15235 [Pseudomonadota bacterium]